MIEPAEDGRILVSYITLRRVVGVLGVSLPIVLALWGFALCGCTEFRDSISAYYALHTRDALVGVLFTIAWFLFAYRGYERKDDRAGDVACIFALGVALFPSTEAAWASTVHLVSATGLFLVLAYFAMFLFTKSGPTRTRRKKIRNRIYIACGVTMLVCIGLIAVYDSFLDGTVIAGLKPVFWLESLALWAFGVSWFIKGETLLKDE